MKPALKMALVFAAGAIAAQVAGIAHRLWEGSGAAQPPAAEAISAPQPAGAAPLPRDGGAARLRSDGEPAPPGTLQAKPAAAASSPELVERERAERAQVVSLQARVRELERRASAEGATPAQDPLRARFHDFTDAELQAMAQNCEVRFDLPRIRREPFQLSPDLGARQHLSEAEQAKVAATVDAVSKDVVAHLRAFYLEATGDAAGADTLDPESLMREVLEKSPPAVLQAARTEIARERAGMPPSPSGTIAERYLRYVTTVGDSLQSALEPTLGAQQAAAVRDALAANRSSMSGCAH